jgi:SAM-dependent methyltransferase
MVPVPTSPGPLPDFQPPDFQRSGNQGVDPELYELENRALDPHRLVLDAMRRLAPWAGRTLVDLGCGSGFWLEGYAGEAAEVVGIEPDPALVDLARRRPGGATVLHGSAEHLPLADGSADVVHARFAYFFRPGCDAGLAEVRRVLRPGGRLVVVDNDQRHGEFAHLLAASPQAAPQGRADVTDAWWAARGAERLRPLRRRARPHSSVTWSISQLPSLQSSVISSSLRCTADPFWTVLETVWSKKTRTVACEVVAETRPAATTFAVAEAWNLTRVVASAELDS